MKTALIIEDDTGIRENTTENSRACRRITSVATINPHCGNDDHDGGTLSALLTMKPSFDLYNVARKNKQTHTLR
jgi:hypothetical protein